MIQTQKKPCLFSLVWFSFSGVRTQHSLVLGWKLGKTDLGPFSCRLWVQLWPEPTYVHPCKWLFNQLSVFLFFYFFKYKNQVPVCIMQTGLKSDQNSKEDVRTNLRMLILFKILHEFLFYHISNGLMYGYTFLAVRTLSTQRKKKKYFWYARLCHSLINQTIILKLHKQRTHLNTLMFPKKQHTSIC